MTRRAMVCFIKLKDSPQNEHEIPRNEAPSPVIRAWSAVRQQREAEESEWTKALASISYRDISPWMRDCTRGCRKSRNERRRKKNCLPYSKTKVFLRWLGREFFFIVFFMYWYCWNLSRYLGIKGLLLVLLFWNSNVDSKCKERSEYRDFTLVDGCARED